MENFDPEGKLMSEYTGFYFLAVCFAGVAIGYYVCLKTRKPCSCMRGKKE